MAASSQSVRQGAAVPPLPPPLYFGLTLGLGLLLQQVLPLSIGGRPATRVLGVVLVAAGVALAAGGVAGVIRHRTTIVPHHAVSTLVVDGVYRWTRNPMYTGLAIVHPGVALLAGSWWPLLAWPLPVLAVDRLVIRREEAYLARRFGARYADYTARVRRWL